MQIKTKTKQTTRNTVSNSDTIAEILEEIMIKNLSYPAQLKDVNIVFVKDFIDIFASTGDSLGKISYGQTTFFKDEFDSITNVFHNGNVDNQRCYL